MIPAPAFPLTAEQIVRGIGFLAAFWVDRTRRPDDRAIGASAMTLALADAMGVAVPVETDQFGKRCLLDPGESSRNVIRPDRSMRGQRSPSAPGGSGPSDAPAAQSRGEGDA